MNKTLWAMSLLAFSGLVYAEGSAVPVRGSAEAGQAKAAICAACHGANGISPAPIWPSHAGQGEAYLIKQLHDFKEKRRDDPVMGVQTVPLTDQDILDLAAYFSAMEPPKATTVANQTEEMLELGERIYRGGILEKMVPACSGCHGADGGGIEPALFPQIAGQQAPYMRKQLTDFRSGALIDERASDAKPSDTEIPRTNDPGSMMRDIAMRMTDKEIEAVANYIQGLGPQG